MSDRLKLDDVKRHLLGPRETILRAIEVINAVEPQFCLVTDEQGRLLGVVTDGDIRRGLLAGAGMQDPVERIMFRTPVTASPGDLFASVVALMQARRIKFVPLLDQAGVVVGVQTLEMFGPQLRENWVVLMAGGLGTRLLPLTEACPKPLLRVGAKPILETILERFVSQGFRRFFLAVNYKSEMIEEHFGNGSRWGVRVEYLREERKLGTAGSISMLPVRPTLPFVVMNADLLTGINFVQLLEFHAEQRVQATMCVREYEFEVPYGVVRIEGTHMAGIDEKPVQRFFVNAGIYVLEPSVLDLLKPDQPCDMPALFEQILAQDGGAAAFPLREYWLDIGRHSDLDRARCEFENLATTQDKTR